MKKIIVCAIVIGAVYFYTSGNSLNFDGDSAEFIVAGYCNGIPHSPGYPLFVRILNCSINIFSGMLNVPASCYLVNNILSAFNLLIAGFIIFRLCGTNENNQYNKLKTISAVFALLYLSVSRTYWTESISAEVYILHLAAISSMTGLMLFDNLISNKPLLFSVVSGAISGFSLCNHLSIVFILPFFFIYAAFKLKKLKYSFVFVLTAAIIYSGFNLDMMRRAASNPELNLGNPANFKSLKYVMLMKQYDEVMNSPIYLQAKWDFLKNNFDKEFDFIFLIISITGFIFLFRNLKREFIILLLNFLIFGACVFFFYSQVSYKGVYDTVYVFFLPLYLILTITFGYGLFGICLFFFRDGNYLKKISGILVIILVFIMIIANMVLNFNHNNMRNLDIFEKYVEDILNETGENGILLTDDDTTVYSIWYYQIVLNMFRDRLVIHPELLKTAWFLKNDSRKLPAISDYIAIHGDKISILAFSEELKDLTLNRQLSGLTFKSKSASTENNSSNYLVEDKLYEYKNSANGLVKDILKHYSIAYTAKGIAYAKKKQFVIAEKFFLKALECDIDNKDAKRNLILAKNRV